MGLLTDAEIARLISCKKQIAKPPRKQSIQTGRMLRNDMDLESIDGIEHFHVYMRQSIELLDHFSIGLMYIDSVDASKTHLLRINGRHGLPDSKPLIASHHSQYHIHRANEEDIAAGLKPERRAEATSAFASFEGALAHFIAVCAIEGADGYFPGLVNLRSGQGELFEDVPNA